MARLLGGKVQHMKVTLKIVVACLFLVGLVHADQYIYAVCPSSCGPAGISESYINGYWGAYGSDYSHSSCRYNHNSGTICGTCSGLCDSTGGSIVVTDRQTNDDGTFCTQRTFQTSPLIMDTACTYNKNNLWTSTYVGNGCGGGTPR
jgi:hypothetical protein